MKIESMPEQYWLPGSKSFIFTMEGQLYISNYDDQNLLKEIKSDHKLAQIEDSHLQKSQKRGNGITHAMMLHNDQIATAVYGDQIPCKYDEESWARRSKAEQYALIGRISENKDIVTFWPVPNNLKSLIPLCVIELEKQKLVVDGTKVYHNDQYSYVMEHTYELHPKCDFEKYRALHLGKDHAGNHINKSTIRNELGLNTKPKMTWENALIGTKCYNGD